MYTDISMRVLVFAACIHVILGAQTAQLVRSMPTISVADSATVTAPLPTDPKHRGTLIEAQADSHGEITYKSASKLTRSVLPQGKQIRDGKGKADLHDSKLMRTIEVHPLGTSEVLLGESWEQEGGDPTASRAAKVPPATAAPAVLTAAAAAPPAAALAAVAHEGGSASGNAEVLADSESAGTRVPAGVIFAGVIGLVSALVIGTFVIVKHRSSHSHTRSENNALAQTQHVESY